MHVEAEAGVSSLPVLHMLKDDAKGDRHMFLSHHHSSMQTNLFSLFD